MTNNYSCEPVASHTCIVITGTPFLDKDYINEHWSEATGFNYAGVPVDGPQAAEGESADDSEDSGSSSTSSGDSSSSLTGETFSV